MIPPHLRTHAQRRRLYRWARARWHRFVLRCVLGAALVLGTTGVAVSAAAAEPAPAPSVAPAAPVAPAPELRKHWYGYQTLLSDGISGALLVGGLIPEAGPYFIGASAVGYSLGAPFIHFAHKRPGAGLASFALRVPTPLVVGGAVAIADCRKGGGDFCGFPGIAVGMTLMAVAVVVDAAFLSHEVRREPPRGYASAPLHVTPTLAVTRQQALVGVAVTM